MATTTEHKNTEQKKVRLMNRSGGTLQPEIRPIVLEYKKKKKKGEGNGGATKEKYSEGLEDIQRLEANVMRISQKGARAVSKGVDTYEHERQKSAEEKTDGAVEDFVHNSAKAASASMKEVSDLPIDIAESLNQGPYRKILRGNLRRASKIVRLWRI